MLTTLTKSSEFFYPFKKILKIIKRFDHKILIKQKIK